MECLNDLYVGSCHDLSWDWVPDPPLNNFGFGSKNRDDLANLLAKMRVRTTAVRTWPSDCLPRKKRRTCCEDFRAEIFCGDFGAEKAEADTGNDGTPSSSDISAMDICSSEDEITDWAWEPQTESNLLDVKPLQKHRLSRASYLYHLSQFKPKLRKGVKKQVANYKEKEELCQVPSNSSYMEKELLCEVPSSSSNSFPTLPSRSALIRAWLEEEEGEEEEHEKVRKVIEPPPWSSLPRSTLIRAWPEEEEEIEKDGKVIDSPSSSLPRLALIRTWPEEEEEEIVKGGRVIKPPSRSSLVRSHVDDKPLASLARDVHAYDILIEEREICHVDKDVDFPCEMEKCHEQHQLLDGEPRVLVEYALRTFARLRCKYEEEANHVEKYRGLFEKRKPAHQLARNEMKKEGLFLNTKKVIGDVPGIEVGDEFLYRVELCIVGLHQHDQAGIVFMSKRESKEGTSIAISIVESGGYENNVDDGDVLIYTGQGGNNGKSFKHRQAKDQTADRGGNLAMINSQEFGVPIRVVRGCPCKDSPSGRLYRYAGLYKITGHTIEKGPSGFNIYLFRLERWHNQLPSMLM